MSRSRFSVAGMGGQYFVRPYDLGGWFVESVTVEGKDITDQLFDLQADTRSIVVTYTDRPSKVSGAVTDASYPTTPVAPQQPSQQTLAQAGRRTVRRRACRRGSCRRRCANSRGSSPSRRPV